MYDPDFWTCDIEESFIRVVFGGRVAWRPAAYAIFDTFAFLNLDGILVAEMPCFFHGLGSHGIHHHQTTSWEKMFTFSKHQTSKSKNVEKGTWPFMVSFIGMV